MNEEIHRPAGPAGEVELATLEQAQRLILAGSARLDDCEEVSLQAAGGRVLAADLRARRDEPSTPRAAVDGYALASIDVASASPAAPVFLSVTGSLSAGASSGRRLRRGEVIRIATGACLPSGADAVVPLEVVATRGGKIGLSTSLVAGENVLPVGADFQRDQLLLAAGTLLGPLQLTLAANQGLQTVTVRRRPEVAVLATGDELIELGRRLKSGQSFASNLETVAQLAQGYGARVRRLGIAADSLEAMIEGLRRGVKADLMVTTGGTGRGEKDLVRSALVSLGGQILFQGVAMKPGKQALAARLGRCLILGLPGRPSATHIAFEQLVRPALLRLQGLSPAFVPEVAASLTTSLRLRGRVVSFRFCRVVVGADGFQARPLGSPATGRLAELAAANGLLKLPAGRARLEKGARVQVQLLDLGLQALSYFSGGPGAAPQA